MEDDVDEKNGADMFDVFFFPFSYHLKHVLHGYVWRAGCL